ncbi:hypothetical protein Acin_2361 [Acidaminococcus intestini RyC-MR95]|uniref:Uncharacterized protein n=1 Tax=Acidaminococcus intestini (strain RyC-MR95) TaxID=568816 RepID=G4Q771_ACIIR|nr:hypothetical protein Acin_2361 [Acidaminococcus intestini RyC-MR95]
MHSPSKKRWEDSTLSRALYLPSAAAFPYRFRARKTMLCSKALEKWQQTKKAST